MVIEVEVMELGMVEMVVLEERVVEVEVWSCLN